MKRTTLIFICVIIATCLIGCSSSNENIQWALNLKAGDIEGIEAVCMPSGENERYKDYEKADFARIVEIVNSAKGKKVDNPEEITGGALTFYITMLDGTRHTFSNNGNVYLVIDGVTFKAAYGWLSSWGDEKLNNKIPDNFVY